MGRRYQPSNFSQNWGEARSSIGDSIVDGAINDIKKTCAVEMNLMLSYGMTRERTINALFPDDIYNKAHAARGIIRPMTDLISYDLTPDCSMTIDYEDALVPPIQPAYLLPYPDRAAPVFDYIAKAQAIYRKYEEVKNVLMWCNRNATPGAIRYYWPTAMKLTPKSPIWADLQEVPSRYSEPPLVGDWLQPMKDAATTVTSSLMLPADAMPREKGNLTLTFKRVKVQLSEHSSYETQSITFNL